MLTSMDDLRQVGAILLQTNANESLAKNLMYSAELSIPRAAEYMCLIGMHASSYDLQLRLPDKFR